MLNNRSQERGVIACHPDCINDGKGNCTEQDTHNSAGFPLALHRQRNTRCLPNAEGSKQHGKREHSIRLSQSQRHQCKDEDNGKTYALFTRTTGLKHQQKSSRGGRNKAKRRHVRIKRPEEDNHPGKPCKQQRAECTKRNGGLSIIEQHTHKSKRTSRKDECHKDEVCNVVRKSSCDPHRSDR